MIVFVTLTSKDHQNTIMAKHLLLLICSILAFSLCVPRSYASENFSLYFVRHAEKLTGDKDPALTRCGKERAKQLAVLLSTANIKSIYSTRYKRTMSTATPLSKKTSVAIKYYSPKHLQQFSLQLKQQGQNSVIVGHSNTTPQLASLVSNKTVAKLTEDDYQMLYQVSFINNKPQFTILKQPLSCH